MNRIAQIATLVLLLIITSCATQVPPIPPKDIKVSTAPKVKEIVKEVVKEIPREEVAIKEVVKEVPKEAVTKEEISIKEPQLKESKPLSKDDRMNAVAAGNAAPAGIVYQKDGTQLLTQSFEGQYTVIDFWATWCGPCVKEGPIFHELGETYKDKNVQFVGISVDRDFDRWNQFLQQRNWQGNNYWMGMAEEEAFFAFAYSEVEFEPGELGIIVGLPKYVIIGPDGKILHNSSYIKPSNPKFRDLLNQHVAAK